MLQRRNNSDALQACVQSSVCGLCFYRSCCSRARSSQPDALGWDSFRTENSL